MSERAELESLQAEAARLRAEFAAPAEPPAELKVIRDENVRRLQRCMELQAQLKVRGIDVPSDDAPHEEPAMPQSIRMLGLGGAIGAFLLADMASRVDGFVAFATPLATALLGVPLTVNVIRLARAARRHSRE